jgi:RND family efflux transporter MFP subunit
MMNPRLKPALPVLVIAAASVIAFAMVRSRPQVERRPADVAFPVVEVQIARLGPHTFEVATQGTVMPRTEIILAAEVAGRVLSVSPSFEVGGFFEKGDVLARIDPRDYELVLEEAGALVLQNEFLLAQEEAQAEVARREWERLGDGEASPLARREPQLARARGAVAAAKAALQRVERDLERTQVRAPFAGMARERAVDVGQFVARGTPLGRIYAVDFAEVRLPLHDEDLAVLELPMEYRGDPPAQGPEVVLRARYGGSERSWIGRVVRTEGVIDPKSRVLYAVAEVEDPYGLHADPPRPPLTMGLFVEATITGREADGVVVIPRAALREWNRVLVVDGEDRLRFRTVEVLRAAKGYAVIGSGIEDGERICLTQLESVVDGMKVRVAGKGPGGESLVPEEEAA